jgi:DNA repair protein RecO (recombination protein O)
MPAEKADAIVLRTVDWSETSVIATLFTREFGKVRGLAKGGRRLKGPFESALDVLALCRIVFLRKSSDALDLLTEAKLLRRFRPPRQSLPSLYAAYYVAELLDELTDDYDPHPDLFDLADETLAGLAAGESVVRRVLRFELAALGTLGHLPALEDCAECGAEVPATGRVAFGQLDGGVLCNRCRSGKRQVAMVAAGSLKSMALLANAQGHAWQRLDLDPRSLGEARGVLNHYVCNLLGKRPKLHEYLGVLG